MLDHLVHRASSARDGMTLAVLLHGRGSDMNDLQSLAPALPESWLVVTPRAPHAGREWGYGPGWAWYRYVAEDRMLEEPFEESLDHLDTFLEQLPGRLGIEPARTVLGGFSQGGTMSLAYSLTRPGAVHTAWNLSGFLAGHLDIGALGAGAASTPVYWGHGLHDPAIPFALAVRGRERLNRAGVPMVTEDFDIGHWIVPEEIESAVRLAEDGPQPPTSA